MSLAVQVPQASLAQALRSPEAYPGHVDRVEVVETHISWVFLAGDFAYKVKKPVRLPFLDFSSLALREYYCREELRLNRRTAPALYLDVVPIAGTPPRVGGTGAPVDWAVRMRRFSQSALADAHALAGTLQPWHVDAIADAVARFHDGAARANPRFAFGSAEMARRPALDNFGEMAALGVPAGHQPTVDALATWTAHQAVRHEATFGARKAGGFVREGHGDLHLGNVILAQDGARLFDCVEFDPKLRWIDVINDVAFAYMDLLYHGLPRLAYRFLDRYLQQSGDYEGLVLLRFYAVYRAMVRAKVALVCMAQAAGPADREAAANVFGAYLALAARLAQGEPPVLALMHGPSASGKTVASQRLLEALGAIRIRSDVERKRLHGLPAHAHAGAAPGEGLYAADATEACYARLESLARQVLAAGYPVVVDAASLQRPQRDRFREVARETGAAFQLVSCRAPADVLRGRIERRLLKGDDASDADLAVLDAQLARAEPLGGDEHVHATFLDTTASAEWHGAVESFARRFRRQPGP